MSLTLHRLQTGFGLSVGALHSAERLQCFDQQQTCRFKALIMMISFFFLQSFSQVYWTFQLQLLRNVKHQDTAVAFREQRQTGGTAKQHASWQLCATCLKMLKCRGLEGRLTASFICQDACIDHHSTEHHSTKQCIVQVRSAQAVYSLFMNSCH